MKQAERAETVVNHDLSGSLQGRAGGESMDVRGGEQLRGQNQRGERDHAPTRAASHYAPP